MAPDPVRAALFARLSGDATLKSLLSAPDATYEAKAPQGTKPPYVILANQAPGVPLRTFGEASARPLWLIRGVCRGESSTPAEEIDARCRVLLDSVKLTISGSLATVVREGGVSYGEEASGEDWRHRGSLFRIYV
jgi:hypothetical protein